MAAAAEAASRGERVGAQLRGARDVASDKSPAHEWLHMPRRVPARAVEHELQCDGPLLAVVSAANIGAAIACSAWRISIWDLAGGVKRQEFDAHGPLQALAYATHLRAAISGARDGSMAVWDATSGVRRLELACPSPVEDLVYIPELRAVVSAEAAGVLTAWDLGTGWSIWKVWCQGAPSALAFMPERPPRCQMLVSGDSSGRLTMWDLESSEARRELRCGRGVTAVACSAALGLVASGEVSGRVIVWEVSTGEQRWGFEDRTINTILFVLTDEEDALVTGDSNKITVWDLKQWELLRETVCGCPIRSLTYAARLNLVISGDDEGKLILWPWDALL